MALEADSITFLVLFVLKVLDNLAEQSTILIVQLLALGLCHGCGAAAAAVFSAVRMCNRLEAGVGD